MSKYWLEIGPNGVEDASETVFNSFLRTKKMKSQMSLSGGPPFPTSYLLGAKAPLILLPAVGGGKE